MSGATGIVWMGPAYDRGGYGAVCRGYVLGLDRIGFPVRLLAIGPQHPEVDAEAQARLRALEDAPVGSRPALVMHATPEIFADAPIGGFVRRIGCTIFETDRIPPQWVEPCNSMDEIWVPSKFNQETFARSGVDTDKLVVVPYGIDTRAYVPAPPRSRGDGPFRFLYVCAFSWRKGIDLLLDAFLDEFSHGEAELVLRVQGSSDQLERLVAESVDARAGGRELPEIELITEPLGHDELIALYRSADLYISTDRANGWGMPCQEAMALGVPAATVDWSGSTEFMHERNSVLIHPTGELESVDQRLQEASPDLYAGHRWAKVEPAEVRRAMRWAQSHPDELRAIARAGCEEVGRELSLEAVAERIVRRVRSFEPAPRERVAGALRLWRPWAARHRLHRRRVLAREGAQ